MKKCASLITLLCLPLLISAQLKMELIHLEESGIFNDNATRTIAFDRFNKQVYSTNQRANRIDYYDYTNPYKVTTLGSINLNAYLDKVTGVDALFGAVAVIGYGISPQSPGKLILFDDQGSYITALTTGAYPTEVRFSPGGNLLVVSCEGTPSDDYLNDPKGVVTVVDLSVGVNNLSQSDVTQIDFQKLDSTAYDPLIRIFGNGGQQSPSQDLEPAGLAISSDNSTAYVSLQENNALAIIDLINKELDTVVGLGYKSHALFGLDASDQANAIHINTYNRLYGMYQPYGLASYNSGGNTYLASANEGAARNYSGYSEVELVKNIPLDPSDFNQPWLLQNDTVLGRLNISNSIGKNGDVVYDSIFSFGTRSFSIWDSLGQLLWDSGEEFEQVIATAYPNNFNSVAANNNSFKGSSNRMGAEPKAITTGSVDGTLYAFITLEQMGGFFVYDLSNPSAPVFVSYELRRDFTTAANNDDKNDLAPTHIEFIGSFQSPIGIPMLMVSNAVSGSISTYILGAQVGMDELKVEQPGLYPNPSTGTYHSIYTGSFKVFNSNGQLIKEVEESHVIDLTDQPAGYYLVKDDQGQALRVIKH